MILRAIGRFIGCKFVNQDLHSSSRRQEVKIFVSWHKMGKFLRPTDKLPSFRRMYMFMMSLLSLSRIALLFHLLWVLLMVIIFTYHYVFAVSFPHITNPSPTEIMSGRGMAAFGVALLAPRTPSLVTRYSHQIFVTSLLLDRFRHIWFYQVCFPIHLHFSRLGIQIDSELLKNTEAYRLDTIVSWLFYCIKTCMTRLSYCNLVPL